MSDYSIWRFENGHVWRDQHTSPWRLAQHVLLTTNPRYRTKAHNEVVQHTTLIPDVATLVMSFLVGFTCEDHANEGASVGSWLQLQQSDGSLRDLHDLMVPITYHSGPFHPSPLAIPTPCCDSVLFSAPLLRTDPRSLFLVYACIGSWLDDISQTADAHMLASLCIFGNSTNSVKRLLTLLVQSVPNQTGVVVVDPQPEQQVQPIPALAPQPPLYSFLLRKIQRARCWLLDGMQHPILPHMIQSICDGERIHGGSTNSVACKGAVWMDQTLLQHIDVMSRFALSRRCTCLHFPDDDQAVAPDFMRQTRVAPHSSSFSSPSSSSSSITTSACSASASVSDKLFAELHVITRKALMSWRVVRFYMHTHNIKTLWEVVSRFDYFINSAKALLVH